MFHKQHPDGRTRVWDEFDWGDPWGVPREEPATSGTVNKDTGIEIFIVKTEP
jgi:hypothetical protein